ncbi:DUF4304 domain-containing protein [Corallococcus sp. AB050B]|nr:DUF4304 domain-containing protein [Corallococcus sp. AB050B]
MSQTPSHDVHSVLALLRFGELRGLHSLGEDRVLCVLHPEVAAHVLRGSKSLSVVLQRCQRLVFAPWAPESPPIEDLERLAALRLQLLGMGLGPGTPPSTFVRVQDRKAAPLLQGGRLFLEAAGCRLEDEAGGAVSLDVLRHAAAEATAETLRTQSVGGYKKAMEAVLDREVEPLLVSQGFQVHGRTYTKAEPALGKLLKIEVSRWSTAHSLSFALQLGLFVGELAGEKKLTEKVLVTKAFGAYVVNVGALWGDPQAQYVLSGAVDPLELGERLRSDLLQRVLPFFERFHTADDVIAFLEAENQRIGTRDRSLAIAMVLARLGRKEESRAYFAQSEGDAEAIRRVARSYGIEL